MTREPLNRNALVEWRRLHNVVYASCGKYKLTCGFNGDYKIIRENVEVLRTKSTVKAIEQYNFLINQPDNG